MISVLLPTYNACHTISRSIKSILGQTFVDYELLILDDGSTDSTPDVVHSFIDQRIRYIQLPHQGLPLTLNEGLRAAKYGIIARMDAGDIAMPTRFMEQYQVLSTKERTAIVSCRYAIFENSSLQYLVAGSTKPAIIKKRLALHPDFPHPGVMYNKTFIVEAGMYHNTPMEDYELWLRLKDTAKFYILEAPLLLVEYSRQSLTNKDVHQRYRDHYLVQQSYYMHLSSEFELQSMSEDASIRGWREYFYGEAKHARHHWKKLGFGIIFHPPIILAWLFSYFPPSMLTALKESRMKQRIQYFIKYYSSDAKALRHELKKYINS